MNNQPIKRRNPFETPIVNENEQENVRQESVQTPIVEKQTVYVQEPPRKTYEQPQNYSKQSRRSTRQFEEEQLDGRRDKYTSTMETQLRRKIKIVCATRGIMFADFVSEACREKLSREEGK
jgi:hypothetical protein